MESDVYELIDFCSGSEFETLVVSASDVCTSTILMYFDDRALKRSQMRGVSWPTVHTAL
jgi:hypothetical protein